VVDEGTAPGSLASWVNEKSDAVRIPSLLLWLLVCSGFITIQLRADGIMVIWLGSMIRTLPPVCLALSVDDLAGAKSDHFQFVHFHEFGLLLYSLRPLGYINEGLDIGSG
jgi:hypothetical protein